ncbi:threonine/serine exporter family protein [Terasakiispira papahanaumokuakeensis]|nr:threonine/serine exporter family protein [Terasakiispira papahanaumokuakeensis]
MEIGHWHWDQAIIDALLAALPAAGFAMIFNVPRQALKFCALGGALTYSFRAFLMQGFDVSIGLATFVAATLMGILGVFWSRRHWMPRPVYTVPAIIPMIPGTYAYETMITLVSMSEHGASDELVARFLTNGVHTLSILFAITFGLAIPSLHYFRRRHPVI